MSIKVKKADNGICAGDVLIHEGLALSIAGVDARAGMVFTTSSQPTYNDDGKQRGTTMDFTTLAAYSINQCFPVKGKIGWWFWRFK